MTTFSSLRFGLLSLFCFSLVNDSGAALGGTVSGAPVKPALRANGFLFIGDSETAEEGNSAIDRGMTWPSMLLRTPNYRFCTKYFNGAIGASYAVQWFETSNFWAVAYGSDYVNQLAPGGGGLPALSPVPVASLSPAVKGQDMLFIALGLLDVQGNRTFLQISNSLAIGWAEARASNFIVVASTVMTNTTMTDPQMQVLTNLNAWIISQSTRWDFLMRPDLVLTNVNLFAADLVHVNTNGNAAWSGWVSTNIAPPLSSLWAGSYFTPEPEFKRFAVSNQCDFAGGFRISGDTGYVPFWNKGAGSEFRYQVLISYNRSAGTWQPYSIRGDNLWLFGNSGVQVVSRYNSADQPTSTNDFYVHGSMGISYGVVGDAGPGVYFVTNNIAANGSLYLDATGGKLWVRTNAVWVVH